jgi:hypothetical protein
VLHPNILKDVHVRLTWADIKDIANNHLGTLVNVFNPLSIILKEVRVDRTCADIINNHTHTLVDFFSPLPFSRASSTSRHMLHRNILKDARVGHTRTNIKDIANITPSPYSTSSVQHLSAWCATPPASSRMCVSCADIMPAPYSTSSVQRRHQGHR